MASQENQAPESAQEQRKKVFAGVLVALMIFVFWWQDPFGLFTREDAGAKPVANAQPRTSPTPKGSPTPQRRSIEEVVTDPLHPELASYKNTPLDGIGRNIFVYPTPTPPPTPRPLPPAPPAPTPPITLVGVNPAGVIGKTGEFTLAVTALKVPSDARIFLDGREIQTKLIDESHLTGMVTAEMIRNPGNLGVQVRSASDAQMYSNSLSLNVAEPPAPPYRYVGLKVSKNGAIAVLKSQADDEVFDVTKGKIIGKRWEVTSITSTRIELFDTQIKVPHTIAFTGDGGS
ncbi:MAG: hypothetical protein HYR56_17610 [Acidobacteria bacterium]|nr:hypothetical protein [Acidobacteriota bacterium]MBI3426512.1 hypothetical protein [Acidobacteriota bacterium]